MDGNAESLRIGVDEDGDQRVSPDAIPEWKIIQWAVWFAIVVKAATLFGTLNFIWATAVLLGGFVNSLLGIDFWLVSLILVRGGLRILGLRPELDNGSSYSDARFKIVKNFGHVLREYSSWLLMFISGLRIVGPYCGHCSDEGDPKQIRALQIFYWVSLVESGLSLIGVYISTGIRKSPQSSDKRIIPNCLALEVKSKYGFPDSQLDAAVHRFFHTTYCRCLSGNILDGLKMEFVSYSVELLQSSTDIEQLMGAQLLSALVKDNVFALERLRSIGKIRGVVEMLIDMLNWGKFNFLQDQEIQRQAAEIIFKLVSKDRYRILVMATPDSMESITSLLYDKNYIQNRNQDGDKLSKLGLNILKGLTIDHDNRAKIGSNKGLLLKIIRLTELDDNAPGCQILAIETLTNIARDEEVRERIGRLDGVLHNLFSLFLMEITTDNVELVSKAGEALGFLSLENNHNCEIIMTIKLRRHLSNLIPSLISLLNEEVRGTYAARILRNLYVYEEAKRVELKKITEASAQVVELKEITEVSAQVVELKEIIEASRKVVAAVMERKDIHQEAAIGLAAQIFKCMSKSGFDRVFPKRGAEIKGSLISKVVEVLGLYSSPTNKVPNIRRFSIELLIALMGMDTSSIEIMRSELKEAVEGVMKTTSVLESYSSFSGSVGLRSHTMAIPSLVESAMELLDI